MGTPAFDIDLFAEPDNEEYNIIGDEMEDPFFQTPAGQQTLPAQVPFSTPIRRVPFGPQAQANPLEAWLAMWAPLYQQVQQQQQARNFQYYPPRARRAVDPPTEKELMEFAGQIAEGEEPDMEFKEHMQKGYKQCYQMAASLPSDLLAKKGPFYEKFGRQMMFFKCSKMMTDANCVMKELSEW